MISWVAMDRIVERKRAADANYRKQDAGKVLRSDAKRLTDGELLAKLCSFGVEMDRPTLERLCDQALSAEEIAQLLLDQRTFHGRQQQMESDWIWICLSALWQRWFPDKPSFEALDDKMQAGYELRASGTVAVCRVWLEAWSDVLRILDKAGMRSIQEFDDRFGGSQSLFNWIQDLESELWNAGLEDKTLAMYKSQLAAAFVTISSIVLLPGVSDLAQQTPAQGVHGRTILFICEHGSAKSVIAAAHFNDLANKNGLPYRAIARGIHPDKEIPSHVKSGLAAEGLNIRGWQPKRFSEEDALRAERVITLGCALPASKSVTARKLQDWNDVPSPNENYKSASQAIAERVASLVRELTGKQALQ